MASNNSTQDAFRVKLKPAVRQVDTWVHANAEFWRTPEVQRLKEPGVEMDKGQFTGLIFIDLKKAFDTVNHATLSSMLQKDGVKELEHDWYKW